jgi:hypothetical protein
VNNILKLVLVTFFFILPWALINTNKNWKEVIEKKVVPHPELVIIILLPSILFVSWRILKSLKSQYLNNS